MPTINAFRLVLAGEFVQRTDFSPARKQLLDCFQALSSAQQKELGGLSLCSEEHIGTFGSPDFSVTLAETGALGKDSSAAEHLSLISPKDESFFLLRLL